MNIIRPLERHIHIFRTENSKDQNSGLKFIQSLLPKQHPTEAKLNSVVTAKNSFCMYPLILQKLHKRNFRKPVKKLV